MKHIKFDEFLEEWWMEHNYEGQSKDRAIEATERWIENLEIGDIIPLADIAIHEGELRGMKHAADIAIETLRTTK